MFYFGAIINDDCKELSLSSLSSSTRGRIEVFTESPPHNSSWEIVENRKNLHIVCMVNEIWV